MLLPLAPAVLPLPLIGLLLLILSLGILLWQKSQRQRCEKHSRTVGHLALILAAGCAVTGIRLMMFS